ncbi:MAG: shikimate kinase [Sphaerochaeta sp.]|nr:shikimate kinase [Sphaerochaeta sp.]
MDTHLFFCGIKHCGKSTLGRLVAQKMGTFCVDNDDLILADLHGYPSIRAMYKKEGKASFMEKETETLKRYLENNNQKCIVSLGGGACDNLPLISLIKRYGKVVYLQVDEKVLLKRILVDGIPPFLDSQDVEGSFAALYADRHERYRKLSDIMVKLPDYPDIKDTATFLFSSLS